VSIEGRVQGVWYRGWTVETARALNLRGWVRNCRDGSVEAVFCGLEADVDAMLAHCHQGPPGARVQSVTVENCSDPVTSDFRQLPGE
jgi:acylphosphatase